MLCMNVKMWSKSALQISFVSSGKSITIEVLIFCEMDYEFNDFTVQQWCKCVSEAMSLFMFIAFYIPLNSFFRKRRKSARPRGSQSSSPKLKVQRSTLIFVGFSTLKTKKKSSLLLFNLPPKIYYFKLNEEIMDLRWHVKVPVCDIIC